MYNQLKASKREKGFGQNKPLSEKTHANDNRILKNLSQNASLASKVGEGKQPMNHFQCNH